MPRFEGGGQWTVSSSGLHVGSRTELRLATQASGLQGQMPLSAEPSHQPRGLVFFKYERPFPGGEDPPPPPRAEAARQNFVLDAWVVYVCVCGGGEGEAVRWAFFDVFTTC